MTLLTRLYAHDTNAVKALEAVRVNPDFTSQIRNDLEFFIPQLCSFYIRGDFETPQDIVNLIVMACSSSFFFSHRIWFFFQALLIDMDDANSKELYKKSRVAMRGIKDCALQSKERLYLANSHDLINLIYQFNMIEYYPQLTEVD